MKKLIIVITAITAFVQASVGTLGLDFVLTSPTNNATYYVNDAVLPIHWEGADRTANSGMVKLFLMDKTGNEVYFGGRPADNGGVDWEISKLLELGLTGTNFTLRAQSSSSATVSLFLLPGSRPTTTTNTPPATNTTWTAIGLNIRKQVSVEWPATTGLHYRVEKSTDLVNWTPVIDGTVDFTDTAGFSEYAEDSAVFYRAYVANE